MTLRTYQELALDDNIFSRDLAKELDTINKLAFQAAREGMDFDLAMCEDGCTRALAFLCLRWSQLVALDTPDRADVVRARVRDFANRIAVGIISYQTVLPAPTPTLDTPNAD